MSEEGIVKRGKRKILIADDSEVNRSILADVLAEDYEIAEAADGEEAIGYIGSHLYELSLVLLDIAMPKIGGIDVLRQMNNFKWIQDIPVIIIVSESPSPYIETAFGLGASDYIQRPFDLLVVRKRVEHAIMLHAKQATFEGFVAEQVSEREREQSLLINILSHVFEFRNGENGMHMVHIRTITDMILHNLVKRTDKYPLNSQNITLIATASALHDIGKITVDDRILNKPGAFTPEERKAMETHTVAGAEIIRRFSMFDTEPLLKTGYEICRWHHERWDGKGYPDGLSGDQIPISAQVVALADVYDALTSERSYKKAYSHEKAFRMIMEGECGAFNPLLLDVFSEIADSIPQQLVLSATNSMNEWELGRATQDAAFQKEMTASKRTLDLLEWEREKYRFVATLMKEFLFEAYVDPVALCFFEESAHRLGVEEVINNPMENEALISVMGKDTVKELFEYLQKATREEPTVTFACDLTVDGKSVRGRITMKAQFVHDAATDKYEVAGAFGRIEDVTEDYERMQALEFAATHDPLTGILTRAQAEVYIRYRLKSAPETDFVLAIADLDDLKKLNDSFGHQYGDKALKELAGVLKSSIPGDGVAARIGGDEFLVFFEQPEEFKIDDLFKTCVQVRSLSMGVSSTKGGEREYGELFRRADLALYEAKKAGKRRYKIWNFRMKNFVTPERTPIPEQDITQ